MVCNTQLISFITPNIRWRLQQVSAATTVMVAAIPAALTTIAAVEIASVAMVATAPKSTAAVTAEVATVVARATTRRGTPRHATFTHYMLASLTNLMERASIHRASFPWDLRWWLLSPSNAQEKEEKDEVWDVLHILSRCMLPSSFHPNKQNFLPCCSTSHELECSSVLNLFCSR